ncbi:MAG: ribonuclease HII [bacterium]|nr:ribonuclease HII [bacterium]
MILAQSQFENIYWSTGKKYIAGIDEVGRGCWAGPAVVGAVVFPQNCKLNFLLADSKLISQKKREELDTLIRQTATACFIAEVSLESINSDGVGNAIQQSFLTVTQSLPLQPDFVLIDAFKIQNYPLHKQSNIIKGDQHSISIAAASIIAKVYRDKKMKELHQSESRFGFDVNKGYGTKLHRDAIAKHGLSIHHRTSFNLHKWIREITHELISVPSK